MNLLRKLWDDQRGAVVSVEILVIATVLVIAVITAWVAVRNAVIGQIDEQAHWIAGDEHDDENLQNMLSLDEVVTCSDVFNN